MTPFWKDVAATCALLGGALALERAHPSHWTAERPGLAPPWLKALVRDLAYHGPNEEDELGLLAGYYEELLNASNDATKKLDPEEGWKNSIKLDETHERVQGYLWYRPKPGLDLVTVAGTRVVTNSAGLADREYALEKPAGARRIAFVGDSLVRGLGAPFGRSLEARFEEWLNANATATPTPTPDQGGVPPPPRDSASTPTGLPASFPTSFEVLNFGVEGYRLTQLLDVALERTPPFHPDVVLLGISDLAVTRNFGNHVARLVHEGIDLKYPFLRELVARAGVERDDTIGGAESKLTRLGPEIVRACLVAIRDGLRERGIALVVVLLPTVTESDLLQRFASVRATLAELAIPTLDLLPTFTGSDAREIDGLRVSRVDHHPNEEGQRRLLEQLVAQLAVTPAACELLLGHALQR